MKTKGFLLVVSGPAGVGKGTICKAFLERHPEVYFSVSATTRRPRPGEIDGRSYDFVSEEAFLTMIEEQQLLEYVFVFNNHYGTPRDQVLKRVANGEVVILEIEIEGAKQVKEQYPEAVMVFILPPSLEELSKRIRRRGTESHAEIQVRLNRAWAELDMLPDYSYFLLNEDVQECVSALGCIVEAEKHKIKRNMEQIKDFYKGRESCDLSSY